MAAAALRWLSAAKASWSSRLTPYRSATASPASPIDQFSSEHHRPSWIIASCASTWPMRRPSRAFGRRYGALLSDSMPPATAMSMSPVAIPCAASITAFRPEPQTLLMVSAAT